MICDVLLYIHQNDCQLVFAALLLDMIDLVYFSFSIIKNREGKGDYLEREGNQKGDFKSSTFSPLKFIKIFFLDYNNSIALSTHVQYKHSCMASKPRDIRCIITYSQPDWKIMYSLVIQKFPRVKRKRIELIAVLLA